MCLLGPKTGSELALAIALLKDCLSNMKLNHLRSVVDVLKIFQSSVSTSYSEKCTPIGLNVSRDQCDQLAIFAHLLQ